MDRNACILRKEKFKKVELPGKLYGYLALCQDLKHKKIETNKKEVVVLGNLPFVSEMTKEASPEGIRHAYWSFLKY